MNKIEKLIEYIINDEDQKARELFHTIVVEKSRDIYESIIEEEGVAEGGSPSPDMSDQQAKKVMDLCRKGYTPDQIAGRYPNLNKDEIDNIWGSMDDSELDEQVAGDQVGQMVDEISAEESMHEEDDDSEEEEFSLDDAGSDDSDGEVSGDLPADDMGSDDMGGEASHDETVMNIDAKLDELLAKFDEIMGGDDMGGSDDMGGDDMGSDDMGGDDMGDDMGDEMSAQEPDMDSEDQFAEGKMPMKKVGGKSVPAFAADGKGKNDLAKKEAKKEKSDKSTTELMREYVDKIQDMNLTGEAEGTAVGATGKKTSVNSKSITGPGADFGGKVVKASAGQENQDGTSPTKASNEYNKGQGEIKSGNVNKPGGTAGKSGFKTKQGEYSTEHGKEGQTTDGSVPVSKKSVQVQNTGKK